MSRIPASDQVLKGADGLTRARRHIVTELGVAEPYLPTAEEQAEQRIEQPLIAYDDQQAADAARRKAVEDLGYGNTH